MSASKSQDKKLAAEQLTREAEEILAEAKERTATFSSLLDELNSFKIAPKPSSTPKELVQTQTLELNEKSKSNNATPVPTVSK